MPPPPPPPLNAMSPVDPAAPDENSQTSPISITNRDSQKKNFFKFRFGKGVKDSSVPRTVVEEQPSVNAGPSNVPSISQNLLALFQEDI